MGSPLRDGAAPPLCSSVAPTSVSFVGVAKVLVREAAFPDEYEAAISAHPDLRELATGIIFSHSTLALSKKLSVWMTRPRGHTEFSWTGTGPFSAGTTSSPFFRSFCLPPSHVPPSHTPFSWGSGAGAHNDVPALAPPQPPCDSAVVW